MPAIQKIALSASRDIPFNKLVLSQSNVRRIKAGVSIEELAAASGFVLRKTWTDRASRFALHLLVRTG